MDEEKNIVIGGGGFAGTTLVQDLEKRLPEPYRMILVSNESYTIFYPMLAKVVGASVFPEQVIAPIRQMIKRTQFISASIRCNGEGAIRYAVSQLWRYSINHP